MANPQCPHCKQFNKIYSDTMLIFILGMGLNVIGIFMPFLWLIGVPLVIISPIMGLCRPFRKKIKYQCLNCNNSFYIENKKQSPKETEQPKPKKKEFEIGKGDRPIKKFFKTLGIGLVGIFFFFLIGGILTAIFSEDVTTTAPNPQINDPVQPIAEKPEQEQIKVKPYTVLKQWKRGDIGVNNRPLTSTGFEILLTKDLEESEIIEIVKEFGDKDSVVRLSIYLTQEAYNEDQSFNYTDAHKMGFLLTYTKNNQTGFNAIQWAQEIGKFQKLYGTETEL